jgi:flagellar biosynthesis anti-sigma factor FlgM
MGPIKLNNTGELESRRAAVRTESERVGDANATPQKVITNSPKTTDSISVSERATALGELAAKAEQLPDIRQERIEQLRTLVQSGDYHPAAADIADAMLKDEKGSNVKI